MNFGRNDKLRAGDGALVAERLRVQVEGSFVGHPHMQGYVLSVENFRHCRVCPHPDMLRK